MAANEKDSAFMSFALHEATDLKLSVRKQNVFTILMTIHVRWLGETGGAFGFALIFLPACR